jgi:hypothetical protein
MAPNSRSRWGLLGAALVVGAMGLAACGSSPGTASSTSSPTPPQATSSPVQSGPLAVCQLALQSEVDAAFGVSLGPPVVEPNPNPGSSKCFWAASGNPAGGLFVQGITIVVVKPPSGIAATSLPMFHGQPAGVKPISGLGDAAASLGPPAQMGAGSVEIFVATHGSLVELSLVNGGSPHTADPAQSMTTLARAVVGRFTG